MIIISALMKSTVLNVGYRLKYEMNMQSPSFFHSIDGFTYGAGLRPLCRFRRIGVNTR